VLRQDLLREQRQAHNVAIVRLEQLYPFPGEELGELLLRHPDTAEVVWVQEEPRNMGPWRFVRERIQPLLDPSRRQLRYVGRVDAASPATGSYKRHLEEQAAVIEAAFAPEQTVWRRLVRVRKSG
jgi:2-oxoglutarate dehydrogenase E1 component